jgi:hypothetical protein
MTQKGARVPQDRGVFVMQGNRHMTDGRRAAAWTARRLSAGSCARYNSSASSTICQAGRFSTDAIAFSLFRTAGRMVTSSFG